MNTGQKFNSKCNSYVRHNFSYRHRAKSKDFRLKKTIQTTEIVWSRHQIAAHFRQSLWNNVWDRPKGWKWLYVWAHVHSIWDDWFPFCVTVFYTGRPLSITSASNPMDSSFESFPQSESVGQRGELNYSISNRNFWWQLIGYVGFDLSDM